MSLIPNNQSSNGGNGRNVLNENPSFSYASIKAQKLVAGVHMITRHINESEPLRTKLREVSISLLSDIVNPQNSSDGSLSSNLKEIISLLDIASASQFVSGNNAEMVKREYLALSVFLEENGESFATNASSLSQEYFNVPEPKQEKVVTPAPTPISQPAVTPRPAVKDNYPKRQTTTAPRNTEPRTREKSAATINKKNARRDAILNLFKDHKGISVKDAAEVVEGVSEKTLQRELVALVAEGVLRKEGERRWSTYYKI